MLQLSKAHLMIFPEPLITIWEPRSYPTLMQFLTQGYSCPRKVLMNSDIQLVVPEFPEELTNVNHPLRTRGSVQEIEVLIHHKKCDSMGNTRNRIL